MVQRVLVRAVFFVLLAFSMMGRTLAQADGSGGPSPYTCDAPCGGDSTVWPWQYPPQPYRVQVITGGCQFKNSCCWVTAGYRFRRVCGIPGFHQVEITSLSWDRNCVPGGFDPVPMIRAVTYGLLIDNPMNFQPRIGDSTGPQCLSNYTVQAATCWKNEPGMNHAENCGVDTAGYACCKGGYQVCRVVGPNGPSRSVQWLGQSVVWNNCVLPCKPSCGAFQDDSIYTRKKDLPPSLSGVPNDNDPDVVTDVLINTEDHSMTETKTTNGAPQRK